MKTLFAGHNLIMMSLLFVSCGQPSSEHGTKNAMQQSAAGSTKKLNEASSDENSEGLEFKHGWETMGWPHKAKESYSDENSEGLESSSDENSEGLEFNNDRFMNMMANQTIYNYGCTALYSGRSISRLEAEGQAKRTFNQNGGEHGQWSIYFTSSNSSYPQCVASGKTPWVASHGEYDRNNPWMNIAWGYENGASCIFMTFDNVHGCN